MGIWWEHVDVNPYSVSEDRVAHFSGEPGAMPKHIPILWRFNQNYHLLEVSIEHGYPENGYHIYFFSGKTVMCCRRELVTRYVAVRIGPKPVKFWIKSNCPGIAGTLTKTGFVYSPIRHQPVGDLTYDREIEAIRLANQATFV